MLRRHRWGAPASVLVGQMWVGWFVVQLAVVGFVSWRQPVYFANGLALVALAALLLPSRRTRGVRAGREGDETRGSVRAGQEPGAR